MKKIKHILLIILSIFLINNTFAQNDDIIIEENGYFFINNSIYMGKKKLDNDKLSSTIHSHNYNNVVNWFNSNQEALMGNVMTSTYYKYHLYKSLYYNIKLNTTLEIIKIEDYSGEELSFSFEDIGGTKDIKLYYDSFFNEIPAKYDWETNDFKIKDDNKYINTPEKIKIYLENNDIIEFDFKFYLPEIYFDNEIENISGERYIILNEEEKVILNIENLLDNSLKMSNGNGLIHNFGENKIITELQYLNYNTPYDLKYINEYDFFYINYKIFNKNSCSSNFSSIDYSINGDEIYFLNNDYNDSGIITNINIDIEKFDFTNEKFEGNQIFSYENILNEGKTKISGINNGLYKIKPNLEFLDGSLCNKYYNVNKQYSYLNNLSNNNGIFFYHNGSFGIYGNIEQVFPNLNNEIDFNINWRLRDYFDLIEKFDFKITNKNSDIIYQGDLSCTNNWSCSYEIQNIINEYLENIDDSEKIILEVNFKDKIENIEKTYKKIYYYNNFLRGNNYISSAHNGKNYEYIIIDNIDSFENINFVDKNGNSLQTKVISEIEFQDLFNEVDEYINQNNLSYDDIYKIFDEKIKDYYGDNIIYNYNGYSISIFIGIDYINTIDKVILTNEDDSLNKIDLKNYIEKFYFSEFKLDNFGKEYLFLNTGIIPNLYRNNSINIIGKNNLIIEKIELSDEEINLYNGYYYELMESEEELKSKHQNKILYKVIGNNLFALVPINIFENIKNVNISIDGNNNIIDSFYNGFEKISFEESQNLDLSHKTSNLGLFSINHSFINPIENTIFIRKIDIFSNFGAFLKINLEIKGENILTKDNSKLYICTSFIENIDDINNNISCHNLNYINNFGLFLENVNNVYIYGINGFVNNNYEKIIIDFEIEYGENIIPH